MMKNTKIKIWLLSSVVLFVAGCGGAGFNATIGGTINGLPAGDQVILLDNGGDALTLTGNASGSESFTFSTQMEAGQTFDVSVGTQPTISTASGQQSAGEVCTVENEVGIVEQASGNVTSVVVNCVPTVSANNIVSGTVSGLAPGNTVTLLDNGNDSQQVSTNGQFAFNEPLGVGVGYGVVVSVQPANQNCVVTNATGTISATTTVTPVVVTCS